MTRIEPSPDDDGMTARPVLEALRSSPLLAGLVTWLVVLSLVPAPLAARILLLAPLVVMPRLILLLPRPSWIRELGGWPSFVAALPLVAAFSLTPGLIAAALTLPWFAIALVATASGIRHGLAHLPTILQPRHLETLGVDAALAFWGVGATFALLERAGFDAGFPAVIVLLTATHFHFAGFGLLMLATLLASARPWLRASVLGLLVGIPITASGFVLSSAPINAIGAVAVGSSGIGVGVALLTAGVTMRTGLLSRAAGLALLLGMPMGIAWSLAILTGQSFLDLATMVRTHGALNSMAILLAVVATEPEP